MTDIDRIKQMVQDGRITPEEGDRLIAVLDDAQTADKELQVAGEAMEVEARAPLPPFEPATPEAPRPPEPARPAVPTAPANASAPANAPMPATGALPGTPEAQPAPDAAARSNIAPADIRWVRVEMLAGNLEVEVDPSLTEPAVESDGPGNLNLEATPTGFRVSWDRVEGGFIDRVLGRLRSGNLDLRIPAGYGIDLAATAGDVELDDVPYLRGHLTAGDLDATGLRGIDFTSRAGNIDVALELTQGAHRVNVTAGDVNVRLAPTSQVTVRADVSIGDADSDVPGVKSNDRGLGASLAGSVGDGSATLDMHVTTGDLDLDVDRG